MIEPKHKFVAVVFVGILLPFLIVGIVGAIIKRSFEAGLEVFDKFVEWL